MATRASTVEEWFLLNQEELIHCPYQSGNLRITKSSCRKQVRKSSEWGAGGTSDNYILFALGKHLEVCRRCNHIGPGPSGFKETPPDGDRSPRRGRSPKRPYG